jgi:gluconolactonase
MDKKQQLMKKNALILAGIMSFLLLTSCASQEYPTTGSIIRLSPELDRIIAPGTLPEILAEGFEWSEGPLWLPEQKKVIFSDVPNNSIFEWSEEDGLKLYLKPSGYTDTIARGGETGSNGLILDGNGQLVLCQHGDRRMARMKAQLDAPAASFETIAGSLEGKRFNSPNDAVFSSSGNLYFTDPAFGMELRYADPRREMDFTGVFLVTSTGNVSLQTNQLNAPNGIDLSPDESRIYVANSGGHPGPVWMEYELAEDGSFQNGTVFYDASPASDSLSGGPDGLVVRNDGMIFATGPGGVWILTPDGEHLGIIRTGQATSNCTLDAENRYLYITADMYLMRIRLR